MNYTDVDDNIIQRAHEEGSDPTDLAQRYIQEFQLQGEDLNILPATATPRATQEIDQIIQMIQDLVKRGSAYAVDGDVYFRVLGDQEYGKLSGRRLEDMQAGARIEVDERKEYPLDFALC
jgi:cysteinyl-tRNA synthetase